MTDTITLTHEQLQSTIAAAIAQALAQAAAQPAPAPVAAAPAPTPINPPAKGNGPDGAALLRDIVKACAGFTDLAGRATLSNPDKTWTRRLHGRVSKAGTAYGGFLPLLTRAGEALHHKTASSLLAKAEKAGEARDAGELAAIAIMAGTALLQRADDPNALAGEAQSRCREWTDAHAKALASMVK